MLRNLLIAVLASATCWSATPAGTFAPVFFMQAPAGSGDEARYLVQTAGLTARFSPTKVRIRTGHSEVVLDFVGANPSPRIETLDLSPGKTNFLLGDERNWVFDLPVWKSIVYRDLYPGVDMVYAGDGRNLKSEFVLAPGTDPACIRIRYSGTGRPSVSARGELLVPADGHELREQAPLLYQRRAGVHSTVPGRFTLSADGTVGFTVNDYDRSLPLVIDPVVYSTYFGGANSDAALAIAVDSAGSAYVAGFTASTNLPTLNPRQPLSAGSNDVFVAKLTPDGHNLVYCTYVGGSGDDRAYGIALDATGAVAVTGSTTSKNFPLSNAWQSTRAGARNAFLFKLNSAGSSLVFSSYLGGTASDTATAVALGANGSLYIAGNTTSTNFPTTGFQLTNHGSQDAFVARWSTAGALLYSTYLGGSYDDNATAIAVDSGGTVYLTGSTYSPDFPTASPAQGASGGGQDAFVARLNAAGDALLFSTYLGGSGGGLGTPEAGQAIAVDTAGNAYVTGTTSSANFPLLQALQTGRLGAQDSFVTRFGPSGTLLSSTYLGGTGIDAGNAIAVDASGAVLLAGQTLSSDLPVAGDPAQSSRSGDYDGFYAKLAPGASSIQKLGYLGGSGADTATAIAVDSSGSIYLAGWTLSTNFPLVNAYQSLNAGQYGAFIAKISGGSVPTVGTVAPASGTGAAQSFTFSFSDPNGGAGLTSASILIGTGTSTAAACAVTYSQASQTLNLLTDSGSMPASGITPGSGSQQNSQCTLNGAGSAVSVSGSELTLTVSLAFQPAFTGAKTVYAEALNSSGTTGWQQVGVWTVPAAVPSAVSVEPNSGSGGSQTFVFTFSDSRGYAAIGSVSILVNSSLAMANGCYILYYPASKLFYLANDAGAAWLSPVVLGGGSSQNSQCTVQAAGSSASGSGSTLTVTLALQFRSTFAGAKNVYMEAYDGADSGWQQRGTWTVPANIPPVPVSVTPSSGSGGSQTFQFAFWDGKGYSAINSISVLLNGSMNPVGGCYILYYPLSKALYLANDAATQWLSPLYVGGSGSSQNSQCRIQAAGSAATGSGTDLTLTLDITFQTSFNGSRNVYMEAYDGLDSGWQQKGTWTVSGAVLLAPVSVTPSSGTGAAQTFSFVFADPGGYAAIQSTSVLINSALIPQSGCYALYYRTSNLLYLANDAGTAWLSPIALGGSGTTQNSQCTITAAGSGASGSGYNLTLTLVIAFKTAFHGTRNVYMEVYDGSDSGWLQKGSWIVP
jgi:hypothetical protein